MTIITIPCKDCLTLAICKSEISVILNTKDQKQLKNKLIKEIYDRHFYSTQLCIGCLIEKCSILNEYITNIYNQNTIKHNYSTYSRIYNIVIKKFTELNCK